MNSQLPTGTTGPTSVVLMVVLVALVTVAARAGVVFHDGATLTDGRVVLRSDSFVVVETATGTWRFPLAVVADIDGEPVIPSAETAYRDGLAAVDGVGAEETGELPADRVVEAELPSSDDVPYSSMPEFVALAAAEAALRQRDRSAIEAASHGASGSWRATLVLAGLVVAGGGWLRSVRWVQRDLQRREAAPVRWSYAALVLPGAGAVAYAVVRGVVWLVAWGNGVATRWRDARVGRRTKSAQRDSRELPTRARSRRPGGGSRRPVQRKSADGGHQASQKGSDT